ncbi:MAG: hypothetical protein Q9162_004905 [Coniocarpon cinnabarinum]
MKAVAGTALLATATFAAPSRLQDRLARRAAGLTRRAGGVQHDPSPLIHAPAPASAPQFGGPESNDTRQIEYSGNWAGAVVTSPPAGTTFSKVVGSFAIPEPQPPANAAAGQYSASAWVGIDGDTYPNAILQAGCDFTADTSGAKSYDCWYEWFPNPLTDFDSFTPAAGDVIEVSVAADSPSQGTAVLTNTRTGQSVNQALTAPSANANLGGQNAEWIVEDFSSGGGFVPFANFGNVAITGASATAGSQTVGISGADILDIQQNGKILTTTTIVSDSEVDVKYIA